MKSVVKSAKTIEAAIEACLTELNADLDDCKVTILEQPKSGLFGVFGQKDAVVRLELKEDANEVSDFVEKALDLDKSDKKKTEEVKEKVQVEEIKKEEKIIEKDAKKKDKSSVNIEEPRKHKYVAKNKKKPTKKNTSKKRPAKEEKKLVKEEVKEEESKTAEMSTEEKEEITSFLIDFVSTIMDSIHIPGDVKVEFQGNEIYIDLDNIKEEDVGIAIGRKAETLNSIQYITAIALNKKVDKYFRVYLNIAGYRERRKDQIEDNARKKAQQVLKTKRPQSLKAMNSYERKLVHFALQDMKNIETVSEGREPYRKVVIKYKK